MVVEDNHITLFPVNPQDQLRCDTRSLQVVEDLSAFLEIVGDGAIGEMQLLNSAKINI